ncbi:MAG: SMP-30/gluconolactonase/LRE family protein [Gammaproteobacteria bacterium]|nr:SMP-30/gluconolactonase/LRE family protein [Gammaproteobacteria bacterium]
MKIERIGEDRYQLGESPIWDPQNGALYFVDCMACAIFRYDPRKGDIKRWDVTGEYLGSLALRANGGAILVMDDGFHSFDFDSGETTVITEPEAGQGDLCFNDCKVDRQGRLIAGSMHTGSSEPVAAIYRLDTDLSCTRLDGDMICPNGPCWSLDGRRLYVSDSYGEAIFAYDYDVKTGDISNRRTFLSTVGSGGYPDGGTVDAEGYLWSAHFDSGTIRRIDPEGSVERVIELPVQWVASLTFGGENHDVLYVTTIGSEYDGKRDTSDQAGGLFAIHDLGIQGLAENRFAG